MRTYGITFEKLPSGGVDPTYMIAICPTNGDVHLEVKTIYHESKTFETVLRKTLRFNDEYISKLPKSGESSWKYHKDILMSKGEAQSLRRKAYVVQ
jgi:hypothetical protein